AQLALYPCVALADHWQKRQSGRRWLGRALHMVERRMVGGIPSKPTRSGDKKRAAQPDQKPPRQIRLKVRWTIRRIQRAGAQVLGIADDKSRSAGQRAEQSDGSQHCSRNQRRRFDDGIRAASRLGLDLLADRILAPTGGGHGMYPRRRRNRGFDGL